MQLRSLTIGICGVGFVGGSLKRWFTEHTKHTLKLYDPSKHKYDSLQGCDATFICVPVPTNEDGTQDFSHIDEAMKDVSGKVFIRSTVIPGTNDRYGTYACPEFLTQRTAYVDMCRMNIVTGCPDREFLLHLFPGKEFNIMSNVEAEISKYAHNVFGAMKVNFFNLIHNLCELRNADYQRVIHGFLMSKYINETHTTVPGPDGEFGFGGPCFPKDLKAFNNFYPTDSFAACIKENGLNRGLKSSR